jgi:RNase H-fold protein (predicted Holliday junction resolvase)
MTERDQELLDVLTSRLERMMDRHTLTCVAAAFRHTYSGTDNVSVDKARDFIRNIRSAVDREIERRID